MSSIIPYVPNLYSAPENPAFKDCYYNITTDKYYAYDGIQWVEAKLDGEENVEDYWKISYKTLENNNYIVEYIVSYDNLITALNRNIVPTDIIIETTDTWCRRVTSTGNEKSNWGLIELKINDVWIPVGRILPKIIYKKSGQNEKVILENVNINNQQLTNVYCNNVLVYTNDYFEGYILTYVDENNNTVRQEYEEYSDLRNFMQTTSLRFKKVSIVERRGD